MRELKYGATDNQSREANSEQSSQNRRRSLTLCASFTMLKEMTLLMIVLWGSQGMPTPTSQEEGSRGLSELYCKAEALLDEYKSVDKKHLSSEAKSAMKTKFSQSNCNISKSAEECQVLQEFKELFGWLKDVHQQDELLKPVMGSFTLLIEFQNNYVNHTCLEGTSGKSPEFDCPKYKEAGDGPSRENMFHYIFELYKTLTQKLLSSKLKLDQNSPSEMCKAKSN